MKFRHRWAATALFVVATGVSTLAHAASISGQGTWESTLQGRDLDGNLSTAEAYYDMSLNITWLANANYAGTAMTWANANTWAAGLNPYSSGITGWRLPTTIDADGTDNDLLGNDGCSYIYFYQGIDCGYNIIIASEMSHMFYATLGDKAYTNSYGTAPQPGWGLTNTGPFSNVQSSYYWSATADPYTFPGYAWYFDFSNGLQNSIGKTNGFYAWAVHSGDVGAAVSSVPVPAAVWLFGSGLAGLFGFARRRARPA